MGGGIVNNDDNDNNNDGYPGGGGAQGSTFLRYKMPTGYHVLLGWILKRIRETFRVPIHDHQLAICVSTPIESMILEQELSLRVLVSSRSNQVAFSE
jgi:hypothetical protein